MMSSFEQMFKCHELLKNRMRTQLRTNLKFPTRLQMFDENLIKKSS